MTLFQSPASTLRKLPVMATFRRAYVLTWENRSLLLRTAWVPLVTTAVSQALAARSGLADLQGSMTEDTLKGIPVGTLLTVFLSMFMSSILLISYSVSWRRHLLLGETPTSFFFAGAFRRYLLLCLGLPFAFVILDTLAMMIVMLPMSGIGTPHVAGSFIAAFFIFSFAIGLWWLVRHILVFTAATIDNREMTFGNARVSMAGNTGRYVGVWILTTLPVIAVTSLISGLISAGGFNDTTDIGALAGGVIEGVSSVAGTALGSSTAALVYAFLVRGEGPSA